MENDEVTVLDIMAHEGLGSFAFELETLHPDLYSVSTAKLLATMMEESHRLQSWPHQPPEQASKAAECHRLALGVSGEISAEEEIKYRGALIIGYLYGRLTLPSREIVSKLNMLEQKKLSAESGLRARDALTELFRRWIKQVAREEWKSDIEQNLRISDVCEKLLPKVHHAKEKLIKRNVRSAKRLPSSKQKIREIIKEVAPPYASRPGAPRTPSSK